MNLKRTGKYFINPEGKNSAWTFPGLTKKLATAAAKGAVGALVVNPNMETFSQRQIDNNNKTGVYFPRENAGEKKVNYALLSHAFAKTIFPVSFDDALLTVRANGSFTPQPTEGKTRIEYLFKTNRNTINASNVIGVLEGTDKKRRVCFSYGSLRSSWKKRR